MTLLAPILAAGAGAVLVVALRGRDGAARVVGLLGLVAVLVSAVAVTPGSSLSIGGADLVVTAYGRLTILVLGGAGLLLAIVAAADGVPPIAAASILTALAAAGAALVPADAAAATWALAAGSAGVVLVDVLAGRGPGGARIAGGALRAVVVAAVLAVLGMGLVDAGQALLGQDVSLGAVAFTGVAVGLGLRWAAVPVHGWAARLADAVPRTSLAPMLAWIPAIATVVVLGWSDAVMPPYVGAIVVERAALLVVGVVTLALGSLAAWLADDLGHAVAYLAIAGGGVALVGVSAVDPAAWAPSRSAVLAGALGVSALVGWVVALEAAFGTRRLPDLDGWARRSPGLAVALAVASVAVVGLPGLAVFTDRLAIVDAAIGDPWAWPIRVLLVAPLLAPVRALVVGVRSPAQAVAAGTSERPAILDRGRWVGTSEERAEPGAAGIGRLRPAGAAVRRGLRTDRAAVASGAVIALAVVSIALSAGGLGLPGAAAGGSPLSPSTLAAPPDSP